MNCVFLCSSPLSHILPTQPVIEYLVSKNVNVYVFSIFNNKERLESYGAKFVEYPFEYLAGDDYDTLMQRGITFHTLINKNKYVEAFKFFVQQDTEYYYASHNFKNFELLYNSIKILKPDFIIRDGVDRYGSNISKLLNIPCIGFLTHTLYSKKFFEQDPSYLYRVFLDALHYDSPELEKYFGRFRKECERINNEVFLKSNTFRLHCHHQFDPHEKLTMICAPSLFQPKESFEEDRDYLLVYPNESRFHVEKEIDSELITFIEENEQDEKMIVYLACGSMLSFSFNFCTTLIDNLIKNGLSIIVGNKFEYKSLRERYAENSDSVYIDAFLPQQFILSKAKLFITAAGQNSVIEAIYHKIPMLAFPLTSEQKMNGLIIEEKNIGRTTHIERTKHKTVGNLISEILTDKDIDKCMEIMHNNLVNGVNHFDILWEYANNER